MQQDLSFRYVQNVYINSADRNYGLAEDFSVSIQDKNPGIKKDVGVVGIVIPYTYYNLNGYNNTVGLSISGNNYPVTLTQGNYTSGTFTSMLNTALGVSAGTTFTSSVSATQGTLSIVASNGGSFGVTGPLFLGTTSTSVRYNSSGSTLTFGKPLNLAGTQFIDVRTDLALASGNTRDNNRSLLVRVPVNTTPFNTIFYNNEAFNYINSDNNTINNIQLSLFDDGGNLMNLNGYNYNINLEFSSNNS